MCERERLIYVPLKLVASWNVLDIDTSRLVCHVSKPIPSNKVLYSSVGSEIEFDLHNIKERERERNYILELPHSNTTYAPSNA